MDLVSLDSPVLREEVPKFNFSKPLVDPIRFADALVKVMLKHNGIGLSANQVGHKIRCFAIKANPIIVCYNPTVVARSKTEVVLDEGCLSIPGIIGKIKRSESIKVRYSEPNGTVVNRTLNGLTARIFLHELDHLDGKLFTWKMSRTSLEMAVKKAKRNEYYYTVGALLI